MTNANSDAPASAGPPQIVDIILRGDPFARLLRRLRVSPVIFALFILAYGAARTLLFPAILGHLNSVRAGGTVILGVLDDWPQIVIELVTLPLIAGFYLWQPVTMQAIYDGLVERLGRNPLAAARAREITRPIGWPGWSAAACIIGLLEAVYIWYLLNNYAAPTWESVNGVMLVSVQLIRFGVFYMVVLVVVRQAFMIVGLNRFFYEFSVEIAPLHPDKAGGLRILGEYALTTGLFVGAIGLTFGMGVLRARLNPAVLAPEFYISMIVYFLMAPVLFFAPLIQAHSLMRKAKGALLAEVAEQFDLEYRKLLDGLRHDVLDPNGFTRVETIQKIYKIAEDAPEWPLDLEILARFAAATVLPFLIPLGTDLFSRLFMH